MSRFSKLIDQLEDLDQQDLRNTAKVFAVTAELYERLQQVVQAQEQSPPAQIPGEQISEELLKERYGTYNEAYRAYQQTYQLKCSRGWKHLLPKVKDLPMPQTQTERIDQLEDTVQTLSEIVMNLVSPPSSS
ncbi:hypothetical protein AWQ21_14685 (plasmid) [Picosynechococcus sp. PCC 7003]|uniref:hypothetical protein n=1 Tax=Picosynechococcus sp. PCC 7003 TaxID=374981 RepID=UPI000810CAEA|nr:hypothetical protein [Picosynechococcus sp. PCC 7003]ANV85778.1 hypothetical protein AWQ21_14685 [Picosynechococcus sp. PCC 7003]